MREKARKIGKGYFFNNTYGLVARREIAEQYGLRTYSDLAAAAGELTFGAEYDFFECDGGVHHRRAAVFLGCGGTGR